MRRLLLLLLGLVAIGTMTPAAGGAAVHRSHDAAAMPMAAGHCPDSVPGAAHACLGCAVQPDAMPALNATRCPPAAPAAIAVRTARPRHPTGFDPPPPRG